MKLKGENLRAFIANWDQVIAGIKNVPDETVLETLFFNQVKNNRSIAHDLQEYHRAEEGTEKKSYTFLITAVRRFLDRERDLSPIVNEWPGLLVQLRPARFQPWIRLPDTSRKATVELGIVRDATIQTASTSIKFHLRRRNVSVSHPELIHPVHALPQGEETRRNHVSFGQLVDALEDRIVSSAMKELPSHHGLQLLPDRLPLIRKEERVRREAGVPAGGVTNPQRERVPRAQETADHRKGERAPKHRQLQSV